MRERGMRVFIEEGLGVGVGVGVGVGKDNYM